MGYSLSQRVTVSVTVAVEGVVFSHPEEAGNWTVHAGARNRSSDVAGFIAAVEAAVADAGRQAKLHATAHGEMLAARGAHRGETPAALTDAGAQGLDPHWGSEEAKGAA